MSESTRERAFGFANLYAPPMTCVIVLACRAGAKDASLSGSAIYLLVWEGGRMREGAMNAPAYIIVGSN